MKSIRANIFNKNYEIVFQTENNTIYDVAEEQLSYYSSYSENESSDIIINICNDLSHHKAKKKNPSIHWEIEKGFIALFPTYKVAFYLRDEKLYVDLAIKSSGNKFFSFVRKFLNMEFATREERIAQTLFEGAIVPSVFFDNEKILVHSAGFMKGNKNIIVGGTGGSGKTSLEIELCLNHNYKFLNDDIAIIDNNGNLLPNLAHPKIYGYNLKGNPLLKKKLFSSLSSFSKFHWWFTFKLFGPSKVRRRLFIKNNINFSNQHLPLSHYFILSKERVDDISIEKISGKKAAKLHHSVILAEYSLFINHFHWHEFNSNIDKIDPIINYSVFSANLYSNALSIFEKSKNYIIRIPLQIDHSTFLKAAVKLIEEAD